jgi:uridine kinase
VVTYPFGRDLEIDFQASDLFSYHKRADLIASLADEIVKRKRANKLFLVGIDGRCASGTTMLANELSAGIRLKEPGLDILRPSVDGFHHPQKHRYRQREFSAGGYYEDAFDYDAVVACVLGPLSGDRFPASCRRVAHCWRTDMPQDAPTVFVGANAVWSVRFQARDKHLLGSSNPAGR